MIVVAILFFRGRFDTRTSLSNFRKCFSDNAWPAVKTGLTEFILHLSYGLPGLLTRKYVTVDAEVMDCYTECLAAFNSVFRVWPFAQSYSGAVGTALLAGASFALGAKRPGRILRLFGWASVLAAIWSACAQGLLFGLGRYIAQIFGDSPGLIDATVKMIIPTYAAHLVSGQAMITCPFLQAIGYFWTSIGVVVITQAAAPPVIGTILYFTDSSHDLFRLLWMYSASDAFTVVICGLFSIFPLRTLWKESQEADPDYIEPEGTKAEPSSERAEALLPGTRLGQVDIP
jgi:Na+-driven multidrug efflux pump